MQAQESFFGRFHTLTDEARNALAEHGKVDEPLEYRFDIEFADRRYAVQGYPQEERIFVGQYLGERGVVWFDELRWDEPHHGWRASDRAAWDFFAGLRDRPSLSHPEAEALAARRPQSGRKESPPFTEQAAQGPAPQTAAQAQATGRALGRKAGWVSTARQALRTVRRVRRTLAGATTPWGAAKRAAHLLRGNAKNEPR